MTGTTISSSLTVGLTLTSSSQNPVTVTSHGKISVSAAEASAIYAGAVKGTITNSGTLIATDGNGIRLHSGGKVTNGSAVDTTALISGALYGVRFDTQGKGKLTNFGTVTSANIGVFAQDKSTVTNGSNASTAALITGYHDGVDLQALGTVTNFATIKATGITRSSAVFLYEGGSVTNGSATDKTATISGADSGVYVRHGAATISNFGTIVTGGSINGSSHSTVFLYDGGTVTNGSATDTSALIADNDTGIVTAGVYGDFLASATVTNFGTISSDSTWAVVLSDGGAVTNGSKTDTAALLSASATGVAVSIAENNAVVTNYGTITAGSGIKIQSNTSTVVNAGTISGIRPTIGYAISFEMGNNLLVVAPGASFIGEVLAAGTSNTIELAAGTGTLDGSIGSEFNGFGTLKVDSGGAWTISGANAIASVDNLGTLILAADGALDVSGSVAAASTGTFEVSNGSTLTIAADTGAADSIKFLGASGSLVVTDAADFGTNIGSTQYAGPLIEKFVAGDQIDLSNVAEAGASLTYDASKGLLQVTDGAAKLATLAFQTSTLGTGTFIPGDDGGGHLLITLT